MDAGFEPPRKVEVQVLHMSMDGRYSAKSQDGGAVMSMDGW